MAMAVKRCLHFGGHTEKKKLISKLSLQLSFQIYSLLAQTEGEKKIFLEWCKGGHIVRLSPRALGCHKR